MHKLDNFYLFYDNYCTLLSKKPVQKRIADVLIFLFDFECSFVKPFPNQFWKITIVFCVVMLHLNQKFFNQVL